MSPVVQQLERTAVGQQFPPRSGSTTSAVSLPGPLTPATSVGGSRASATSPQPAQQAQQAAPMAYNPAAPAAPEPIAHREKTPPPMDDGSGTGLQNAAKYDSIPHQQYTGVPNTFQNSNQTTPNQAYFSGPPQQQQQLPGPPPTQGTPQSTHSGYVPPPPPPPSGTTSPPQTQAQSYNPSFAPPPGQQQSQATSPPPNQQNFNRQSSFGSGGPPGQTQYATYVPGQQQRTPSFGPGAVASPGIQSSYTPAAGQSQGQQPPTPSAPPAYSSPGLPPPPGQQQYQPQAAQQQQQQQPQQQSQQAQQGVFGYSNYSYTGQQQYSGYQANQPQVGYTGDTHGQVYRPTEAEAGAQRPQQQQRRESETRTQLEGRVRAVEGKVGGYLKRLDKLW